MKSDEKKQFRSFVIKLIAAFAVLFLVVLAVAYHEKLTEWGTYILNLFSPILLGLAIAYICNPVFRFFERRVFFRLRPPSLRRGISLVCTYLTFFLLIASILWMILPSLAESIATFVANYDRHAASAIEQINGVFRAINEALEELTGNDGILNYIDGPELLETMSAFFGDTASSLIEYLAEIQYAPVIDTISGLVSAVADVIFALFISLYFLVSKEKRYAQVMKFRRACFSDAVNSHITKICTTLDHQFGRFLEGRLLDSLIVAILTYLLVSLLGIPYALLIAVFVAILNIIPLVGIWIGIIPAAFIILMTEPAKFLTFLLFMFLIQQIDSNIIAPKIVGNNTGLSTLCVIIAVCTMGAMWGFVGMIVGVPLFATVLELIDSLVHRKLQAKQMPDDTENYYAPDQTIDPRKDDGNRSLGKILRAAEHRTLYLLRQIEQGHEDRLTRKDRVHLRVYEFCRRHGIIREIPLETRVQYTISEAEHRIAAESAQAYRALCRAKLADISDDTAEKGGC
ncbi:MAG: AI-2E family transporter [Clostridia bacterium]|nr:AI-2E family transporter [Clostridia bacterium]